MVFFTGLQQRRLLKPFRQIEKHVFDNESYVVEHRPFGCGQRQSNHHQRGGSRFCTCSAGCPRCDKAVKQLAEISKAYGEIKSSNSSMTDLEEVELRMST